MTTEAIRRLESPIDAGTTAEDLGHVLFVGVGGVGLSGVARLYATRGLPVSGSELHDWPSLGELAKLGVTIFRSHEASNLDGIDTVVRSTAHPDDHIELVEARRRGLRILHRSEALAAAMTGRRSVVVSGTHGKTTTTAMVTEMLVACGLDPSFVNGGESAADGRSGANGTGEYFVTEADESDRSFLRYRPDIAILTNIDVDHLNTYGTMDALVEGFTDFCRLTAPDGTIVICVDDAHSMSVAEKLRAEGRRVMTYGVAPEADLRLSELDSDVTGVSYRITRRTDEGNVDMGRFSLPVPGTHLGVNSAAAVAVGLTIGLEPDAIRKGLGSFGGVRRRFELRGTRRGVRVFDEYAYHPTAMTAAITTLKGLAGDGRLTVVFQPYRVYRTRDLRAEIAAALGLADKVVVMEIFGPGEELPPGDAGEALAEAVQLPAEDVTFVPEWNDVAPLVASMVRDGDVVVTMGAPPISLMPSDLLTALAE